MSDTNFPSGQDDKIAAALQRMSELGVPRHEIERWRDQAHTTATFVSIAQLRGKATGLGGLLSWLEREPGPTRNLQMPLLLIGMELGEEAKIHFEGVVEQYDGLAQRHPEAAKVLREQVLWRTHGDLVPRADAALS